MSRYIVERLLMLIPVLLSVAFIIFAIMNAAEGDPVYSVVSADATQEQIEAARIELGLDGTLIQRYFRYVGGMIKGDLGTSYVSKRDVMQTYMMRLPNTLKLAAASMVVALVISIPLGIIAAVNQNSIRDAVSMVLALLGLSMPNFWLGLLLILLFSLRLGWFPSAGYEDGLRSIILPAITNGTGLAAFMTRATRSSMLDVVRQDFLRTARAKGVTERKVIRKHALRNALIPIITVFGVQFSNVLGGSVLVETVFAWPGVGRLVVDAIEQRDIPTVTGALVMTTMLVTITNLLIDIVYAYVDPRIKSQYAKKGFKLWKRT
ncbi:MAG TPA: ABC transporter permease [Clostridiaceae bacterium]|nr:ABC transporter permease [Clostridiaceae bacterium]